MSFVLMLAAATATCSHPSDTARCAPPSQERPRTIPTSINEKVSFGGKRFRVWVSGRLVKVYPKATTWRASVDLADQMRGAVKQLTGCEMREPTWDGNHLTGFLDCAPAAPS